MARIIMIVSNPHHPDLRVQREAVSLVQIGHAVTVLAWDRELKLPEREIMDGVNIVRFRYPGNYQSGLRSLWARLRVCMVFILFLLRRGFDVVHCHDLDTLPVGFIAARLLRKSVLFDSHENYGEMLRSAGAPPLLYLMAKWIEKILAKRVDAVICIGKLEAKRFKNMKVNHVYIVGNYQDASAYNISAADAKHVRDSLGITSENSIVISYIGQLDHMRCLKPLFDAIEDDDDVHLILAGWGINAQELADQAALMPNVHFLGFLDPPKVPLYMHASDIVYSCLSLDYLQIEWAMPNKLSQAMLAGKPIMATDRGEMAKVIREENCGILVDIPDGHHVRASILQLKDPNLRSKLGNNAAQAGQREYNWNSACSELKCAYNNLFKNKEK